MSDVPTENAISRAEAAQQSGDFDAAEQALRNLLELDADHLMARNNLAALVARRGDAAAALDILDELIAEEPGYSSAHFNRANALLALGRNEDAIVAFRTVTALEPDHIDAHRALAFQWLSRGDRDRAMDHFARTYDLRRGEGRTGVAERSLRTASAAKLKHDSDLFRNLPPRVRDGHKFETLARIYDSVAADLGKALVELSGEQLETLGPDYNTALHLIDAPEIFSGAVNPDLDGAAIQAAWSRDPTCLVTIDDLLTPRALALIQRFLGESTIWHDFTHIGGFVATYLEDGFACPLVLQIADEFRAALPGLLGHHPLTQAWAFKALSGERPIDIHADDAAVSLNFWVTADTANRNPDTGGLIIYTEPPPEDWPIVDYEADQARIRSFLAENGDSAIVVPYRQNRGILFNSRLFHGTHRPDFAPGYENHRINVTLLFGTCG